MAECKFILGRWEEQIHDITADSIGLVYTDPPYGMGYISNIPGDVRWNKTQKTTSKFDKPILNDKHGDIDFSIFAREMYRIMKPDAYLVLHCNTIWIGKHIDAFLGADFTYKGTIAWNKRFAIGGDIGGSMKRDWEPILYLAKGKPKTRPVEVMRNKGNKRCSLCGNTLKGQIEKRERISEIADWTFQLNYSERTGFPTQKPKALCAQIITMMSDENDIVLDPFAGSGTIGKTATALGRNSISFEADQEVYSKFLSSEVKPLAPLADPLPIQS